MEVLQKLHKALVVRLLIVISVITAVYPDQVVNQSFVS